jgi:hypothetical protein
MRYLLTVIAVLLFLPSPGARQDPKPQDLSVVIRVLADPAATEPQRTALVGREYQGTVIVRAVRLNPDGSVLVDTTPAGQSTEQGPVILLRFAGNQSDQRVMEFRRDQAVRVRAKLAKFGTSGPARRAEFTDLTILPPG